MISRRDVMIAGAASAVAGAANAAVQRPSSPFPKGFLWGAATAGHQIEGNNVASDMWFVENLKPTFYPERSGDACNSFDLWPTDLDLVKHIGLNSYRFSLEWARIEPEQGQFSVAMLDHYKTIIDGCRARDIHPFVTFNHYSAPRWFAAQGGWTNTQAPGLFARYCEKAARHLAGGIGHAATLNEPNMPLLIKDLLPASASAGIRAIYRAAGDALGSSKFTLSQIILPDDVPTAIANLIAAHKGGRAAIKAVRPELPVGACLSMADDQAVGADSLRDNKRKDYYGAWLEAVTGDDFVGVQNYHRTLWNARGKMPAPKDGPRNIDGTEVYAPSLANAVRYAHQQTRCPIIVSEHGVDTPDDSIRAWLIPAALKELSQAIGDGVPVLGYYHWSLMDNFEWSLGYSHRYGLASVDRTTFKRSLKPSAAAYRSIAQRNML
ncbi:family 1 glycosylhydrolase [Novosphingobium chloroacetimidivorans]|nr:family 1 glycosylhydrolase [Novosphingobium chloroacetimidivorans]